MTTFLSRTRPNEKMINFEVFEKKFEMILESFLSDFDDE